jgi:NADH-quinone oxidoreductase subunit J
MTLLYQFTFYFFGLVAVVSACVFVTRKSPVAAALWLVNVMFCLSALFVMLDAQFLGAIQVLVYAGAIMVVFLFVIMLLNLGQPGQLADTVGSLPWVVAGLPAIAVLAAVLVRLPHPEPLATLQVAPDSLAAMAHAQGAVAPLATPLFTTYLLAFEVTSVLLLAAVIGAVVLGRRRGSEEVLAQPSSATRDEPKAAPLPSTPVGARAR